MQNFQRISALLVGCLFLVTVACNRPKDEPAAQLNPGNADAVSQALKITGAVSKQGTPPAPSNVPGAPSIDATGSEKIRTAPGFTFLLDADVTTGNAAGFYLQVNNAKNYYQVPLNNSGGRKSVQAKDFLFGNPKKSGSARTKSGEGTVYLPIEIPANIAPGEFCITYCVYDDQGRVSNLVTRCIQIVQFGGDKSIAKSWRATKDEVKGEVIEIGKEGCTLEEAPGCETSNGKVFYSVCTKTNKFEMLLNENGSAQLILDFSLRYPKDSFWQNCTQLEYKTEAESLNMSGGWSYNASTKQLALVFNYAEVGEEVEVIPVEWVVTKLTDTELIVKYEDDGLTYFVKK